MEAGVDFIKIIQGDRAGWVGKKIKEEDGIMEVIFPNLFTGEAIKIPSSSCISCQPIEYLEFLGLKNAQIIKQHAKSCQKVWWSSNKWIIVSIVTLLISIAIFIA